MLQPTARAGRSTEHSDLTQVRASERVRREILLPRPLSHLSTKPDERGVAGAVENQDLRVQQGMRERFGVSSVLEDLLQACAKHRGNAGHDATLPTRWRLRRERVLSRHGWRRGANHGNRCTTSPKLAGQCLLASEFKIVGKSRKEDDVQDR